MTFQGKESGTFQKGPKRGLYCHVPFCASACDFCAFYQEKPQRSVIEDYLIGMEKEFAFIAEPLDFETVFWGGGTPGLLPAKDLERLGQAMLRYCQKPPKEWTVEMAPSTVKPDKLKVLRDLGVTRISMGVQSFQDQFLKSLGRLHAANQVLQAHQFIQAAGFNNMNIDLMFAIPGQTWEDFEKDLIQAKSLGTQHISTYCLTFEEDTALYVQLSQGKVKIDKDKEHDFYLRTWDWLTSQGYSQYEVSNFSHPGFECIHNMDTWNMQEWLGVGPSACSQWQGKRFSNPRSITDWLAALNQNTLPHTDITELTPSVLATDALIFGLRMPKGVNLQTLKQRFPKAPWSYWSSLWQDLADEGLLLQQASHIALTTKGLLIADAIGLRILELSEGFSADEMNPGS